MEKGRHEELLSEEGADTVSSLNGDSQISDCVSLDDDSRSSIGSIGSLGGRSRGGSLLSGESLGIGTLFKSSASVTRSNSQPWGVDNGYHEVVELAELKSEGRGSLQDLRANAPSFSMPNIESMISNLTITSGSNNSTSSGPPPGLSLPIPSVSETASVPEADFVLPPPMTYMKSLKDNCHTKEFKPESLSTEDSELLGLSVSAPTRSLQTLRASANSFAPSMLSSVTQACSTPNQTVLQQSCLSQSQLERNDPKSSLLSGYNVDMSMTAGTAPGSAYGEPLAFFGPAGNHVRGNNPASLLHLTSTPWNNKNAENQINNVSQSKSQLQLQSQTAALDQFVVVNVPGVGLRQVDASLLAIASRPMPNQTTNGNLSTSSSAIASNVNSDTAVPVSTTHEHKERAFVMSSRPVDTPQANFNLSRLTQQPFSIAAESADGFIYQVQFKRQYRWLLLGHCADQNIGPEDFVKVEADRGEDLGIVCNKVAAVNFHDERPTAGYRGRGGVGQAENKRILGKANSTELAQLAYKHVEEERAVMVCREKVAQHKLPMAIVDAAYQFDRHKLTFFFEADRRIDFRELVSDLFALYKTRIWMQQIDDSFKPIKTFSRALALGTLDKDNNMCMSDLDAALAAIDVPIDLGNGALSTPLVSQVLPVPVPVLDIDSSVSNTSDTVGFIGNPAFIHQEPLSSRPLTRLQTYAGVLENSVHQTQSECQSLPQSLETYYTSMIELGMKASEEKTGSAEIPYLDVGTLWSAPSNDDATASPWTIDYGGNRELQEEQMDYKLLNES
jgi:hypothetical protein